MRSARLVTIAAGLMLGLAISEAALRELDFVGCPVFETVPPCGFLARPSQWVSGLHKYHINRYGLRGLDFSDQRPTGTLRVAFIGDSITFGGGHVSDQETFVEQVASSLETRSGRKTEAINISE